MPSLRAFAAALDCTLVVTQPPKPAGRGKRLAETPVARAAAELGIPVATPERLREALPQLAAERADVFALASYGKLVPQAVLDLPPLGALNVHPSALPLYRGATPLQAQLRDGVTDSAVTIIAMDAGLDTGDVVARAPLAIGAAETYGELHDRAAALGAELLGGVCRALAAGETPAREPQRPYRDGDGPGAAMTRPLRKDDLQIRPGASARAIVDLVRSLAPAPGARLALPKILPPGETLKVGRARALAPGDAPPLDPAALLEPGSDGIAFANGTVLVAACDGWVVVERLTPPSKREMSAADYAGALTATALAARYVSPEALGGKHLIGPERFAPALRAWAAGAVRA